MAFLLRFVWRERGGGEICGWQCEISWIRFDSRRGALAELLAGKCWFVSDRICADPRCATSNTNYQAPLSYETIPNESIATDNGWWPLAGIAFAFVSQCMYIQDVPPIYRHKTGRPTLRRSAPHHTFMPDPATARRYTNPGLAYARIALQIRSLGRAAGGTSHNKCIHSTTQKSKHMAYRSEGLKPRTEEEAELDGIE